jgi:hypothetical protein
METNTTEIKLKPLFSRIHPEAFSALDRISKKYTMSGLLTIAQQEHLTYAIILYSKMLDNKHVEPGDDIAQKLGL